MMQEAGRGCRRLEDKVALVAGAATGIGRATVLRLAAEGAAIVVASPPSDQALVESLVAEVQSGGGQAIGTSFDATDEATVAALVATATAAFGRLDAVHANFADMQVIRQDSDVLSISDEVLERTLDVDLKGMVRLTRHALPALLANGGGAMIYTSSTASKAGEPVRPCYAMAKAGINALVRHIATVWGPRRIRANAVLPGLVLTPERNESIPEEVRQSFIASSRSWRHGEVADIAAMVALLASKDGEWINGQAIAVDGGWSLS
jgi:NAD(P)-dependent dehydrogenase (short-subunit alcohol dehydrogenase family)